MNDLSLSLLITALTGLGGLLILLLARRRRQEREELLQAWCSQRGLTCSLRREARLSELRVSGEAFSLQSSLSAHRQEEATGSSAWDKRSLWQSLRQGEPRPAFLLGAVNGAQDWQRLPAPLQEAALTLLERRTGRHYDAHQGQIVHAGRGTAYLLFEDSPGTARQAVDRLLPLLAAWPDASPLLIQSGGEGLSIRADNYYIRDPAQLELLLKLGEACQ
ncbi:MAG: hypothetical protein AB9880_10320 [Christensenellales bacterium]